MDDNFYRIKRLPPYVFTEVNQMKAQARAAGEDIIDLGHRKIQSRAYVASFNFKGGDQQKKVGV